MAFGNFWRGGGRERFGGEHERDRDRDRWRTSGGDWRDEDRGSRDDERYGAWQRDRDEYGGRESRERESGDYYGDRSRGYGSQGYGSQDYGNRQYGSQSYGSGQGSGSGQSYGGERYRGQGGSGSDYGRRWGSEQRDDYQGTRYGSSDYDYRGGSGGGYGQSGYGQGSSGYGQSGYGQSGYGQGSSGQGSFGQGSYGQGSYGQSGYGQSSSQGQGMFRGRGPRGYRRSDERIREDVCDCLTDDPQLDASNLEVQVKDCEVTLSGSVNRREDKRRAEDLAERISGVKDVRNNLRVSSEQQQSQSGTLGQQGQQQQGQQQQGQQQQGQTGQSPRH